MTKLSVPLELSLKVIIQAFLILFHLKVKGKTQLDFTGVKVLLFLI